jgi:hypothetical protein
MSAPCDSPDAHLVNGSRSTSVITARRYVKELLIAANPTSDATVNGAPVACGTTEAKMRYIVAWMLGVPLSVIAVWYVIGHAACGR